MSIELKPTCAVHGMLERNVMCGSILVGGKYCGFKGECPHKIEPAPKAAPGAQEGA